ncbi:MAG: SDR family NAD(P)-dependent oxidoreductase, partial [Candidatus Thermoplasmatota archaeon]
GIQLKDYPTIGHVAGFVSTHAGRSAAAQAQSNAAALVTSKPTVGGIVRRVPRIVEAPAHGNAQRRAFVVGTGELADALRARFPENDGDVALFMGSPRELFLFAKQHAVRLDRGELGIMTLTHLGGEHGIPAHADPPSPSEGGVTGLAKALAAEFPKAFVRALDLDSTEGVPERVRHVEDELYVERSRVEVGRRGDKRFIVRTIQAGASDAQRPKLVAGSVLVVTGGARGITAEVLKALAPQRPTLILLGRTAAPTDSDNKFNEATYRDMAKVDLTAKGQRATPVSIEKWVAPHKARHEVALTMKALRDAGATVEYHAADASDAAALGQVLAHVRRTYGHIDGVLHAAGVEESKKLADKDDGAFDRAWKPKAEAAFHLAQLTEADHLKFFVMFGSVAGRYGNAAQADYSAANDAQAKLARKLRHRGVAASVFCWGPWGETGMALKGSTLTVLAAAGVEPLTTREGVNAFLSELSRLDEAEVVLAKSLGLLEAAHVPNEEPQPLKRTLDAKAPALDHHRVDGVPYLAGVLGLQAFVDASKVRVTGFQDVHFGYPVKLLRDEPLDIMVHVDSVGNAKLTTVPKGPVKQERTHFTATLLTALHTSPAAKPFEGAVWAYDRVYPPFFHGPAFRVLSRATKVSFDGVEVEGRTPADGVSALAATLEGAFQALGLWGLAVAKRMALPERIAKVSLHEGYQPGATTYRVTSARLTDDRVVGDVQCIVEGKVVAALGSVQLIVTGSSRLDDAPQAWRHEEKPLGGGIVVVVRVDEARALLERPALLPTWLGAQEQAALAGFTVQKRREEWLAATLAGKTALRNAGDARPFARMEMLRGPDGAPLAHDFRGLTLAHAGGVAVARVFDAARECVGVDVEPVEARSRAFEEEAFTAEERARFPEGPARAGAVTLAWCAKEAVLKALGLGLSADLHSVQTRMAPAGAIMDIDLSGKPKERFVALDGSRLRVDAHIEGSTGMALATVTLVRRAA